MLNKSNDDNKKNLVQSPQTAISMMSNYRIVRLKKNKHTKTTKKGENIFVLPARDDFDYEYLIKVDMPLNIENKPNRTK